jgi:hypothetical protein
MGHFDFVTGDGFADRYGKNFGIGVVMKTIMLSVLMCVLAAIGGYTLGKSRAKTQVVEKQVEVIKYVAQKRSKIQAEPNARRDELLELMRAGKL